MGFIGPMRQESLRQENCLHRQRLWGYLAGSLIAALIAGSAYGEPAAPASQPGPGVRLANSPLLALDYSEKTDVELTRLGARWDDLSQPERDALLREVKLRMAQRKDADGVLMIRTQRRYGRIYGSDGRYLKIETKVIQVRPAGPGSGQTARGPNEFGVGFEQRTANVEDTADGVPEQEKVSESDVAIDPPPVVRVNGTSQ